MARTTPCTRFLAPSFCMAEFRCKVTVDHLINHDAGVNWIDLYHSPYINVSRKNIEHLGQNPFGRFTLEETVKK